ncbi:MAG: DUF6134 family protein [Pseudomonadota bacterium]
MRSPLVFFASTLNLLAVLSTPAFAMAQQWDFEVFLDKRAIGRHVFTLDEAGGRTAVTTRADFRVRFLGINAYQYTHQNAEVWENGCLIEIDATTDDNGDALFVRGRARQDSFELETQSGRDAIGSCPATFAYWDLSVLARADRLLNAQTGQQVPFTLTELGDETLGIRGQNVEARRYQLTADGMNIWLWYAKADDAWLQLDSVTRSGKRLRYRLQ